MKMIDPNMDQVNQIIEIWFLEGQALILKWKWKYSFHNLMPFKDRNVRFKDTINFNKKMKKSNHYSILNNLK